MSGLSLRGVEKIGIFEVQNLPPRRHFRIEPDSLSLLVSACATKCFTDAKADSEVFGFDLTFGSGCAPMAFGQVAVVIGCLLIHSGVMSLPGPYLSYRPPQPHLSLTSLPQWALQTVVRWAGRLVIG